MFPDTDLGMSMCKTDNDPCPKKSVTIRQLLWLVVTSHRPGEEWISLPSSYLTDKGPTEL